MITNGGCGGARRERAVWGAARAVWAAGSCIRPLNEYDFHYRFQYGQADGRVAGLTGFGRQDWRLRRGALRAAKGWAWALGGHGAGPWHRHGAASRCGYG